MKIEKWASRMNLVLPEEAVQDIETAISFYADFELWREGIQTENLPPLDALVRLGHVAGVLYATPEAAEGIVFKPLPSLYATDRGDGFLLISPTLTGEEADPEDWREAVKFYRQFHRKEPDEVVETTVSLTTPLKHLGHLIAIAYITPEGSKGSEDTTPWIHSFQPPFPRFYTTADADKWIAIGDFTVQKNGIYH